MFSLLTIGEITVNEKVRQTFLQIRIYENLRFLIEGMSSYMLLYTAFMCMKHISMHVTQKMFHIAYIYDKKYTKAL